ncbi:hypothetical protein BOSE62_130648 [Bosea sp. 62]|uniref:glycosyltransferase n=1 Tax=unclassified Bosea (in: a-proteobacteria) TaxID=2653178 RepID=UPI00125BFEF6|nr:MULTISPECIES: glycosyltransferase [unclassified Bosea (in: a-proteobacteria)]CAD5255579.1 hypothetical protein BOSE7B_120668 [Bosea sp. 7B]CAD5275207.1 hypothetical protein BOSE21B_30243 [Bosea sp. 21B]CAD5276336.1 hypothetical protein BOSE46_30104 [Bosea sp. 46]VVT60017.1 hypothetical protein BOS5A_210808 [Bosea sp. EC-HK365B]VXB51813.1 hypothetical protein BOSE62_130648 [Bosea sp. 62]
MLYILDPNLRDFVGHYLEYDRSVSEAAKLAGLSCVILGHRSFTPSFDGLIDVRPIYSADIWNRLPDHDFHSVKSLEFANSQFAAETILFLKDQPLGPEDIIFIPTLTKAQIAGVAALVQRFGQSGAAFEIMLRYQPGLYDGTVATKAFRSLERLSKTTRIRLSTDSHRLSSELGMLTALEIAVYPIPHTDKFATPLSGITGDGLHFVSLGNARGEKGLAEIFDAIEITASKPWADQLRFTLQCNDPSEDVRGRIARYKEKPDKRVTLIEQAMGTEAYYELLGNADVVLVPYHVDIYASRTSGVFLEAMTAGKIAICTRDTWMSDQLDLHGGGIAVDDRSAASLAIAISDVLNTYDELHVKAQVARAHWKTIHTPENLISHLKGSPAFPVAVKPGRRAAVIYPWGDAIDGGAGAATRLHLLVRYLEQHYDEIRVAFPGKGRKQVSKKALFEAFENGRWDNHWLRRRLEQLSRWLWKAHPGKVFHLWNHIWPLFDPIIKRRSEELARWADDAYLEYSYFSPVVSKIFKAQGKPVVLTQHDILSEISSGIPVIHDLTRVFEFRGLRAASRVVVATEYERKLCSDVGIKADVIPHPIDAHAHDYLSREDASFIVERILELPAEGRTVCLFVGGSYGPNKSAAALVRSMAETAANDPDLNRVLFVVAGACMEPQHAENFVALGKIESTALSALYRVEPIVLIPINEGTGSSIKSIEALAAGCPIISTTVGMRGLAVEGGRHCIIEDNVERFPLRLKQLMAGDIDVAVLRREAREFGKNNDYRRVFQAYDADRASATRLKAEEIPASVHFRDLVPRVSTSGTDEVKSFLAKRLGIPRAELDDLPEEGSAISNKFRHWQELYKVGHLTQIWREAGDFFEQAYEIEGPSFKPDARAELWNLLNSENNDLAAILAEALLQSVPKLQDAEISYIAAQALHRVLGGGSRVLKHYGDAIANGYDDGWAHYHRGHLWLMGALPDGVTELKKAVRKGGEASSAAKKVLSRSDLKHVALRGVVTRFHHYNNWRNRFD